MGDLVLKKFIIVLVPIFIFSAVIYCMSSRLQSSFTRDSTSDIDTDEVEESINTFDDKLFSILSSQEGNVNYSAFSIYNLLYAIAKGSEAKTYNQIYSAMDFIPSKNFEAKLKSILDSTENISNSIWYMNLLNIQNDYKKFLNDFAFEIKAVDFTKASSVRNKINSFISSKSHKMINNFLSENLDINTKLILLNTLYFNQKWLYKFDREDTYEQAFYKKTGDKIYVPMMHKAAKYLYYEDETFQAIEVNYKKNRYSMVVFLPKKMEYNFSEFALKSLLKKFDSSCKRSTVLLALPKFDLTSKYELCPLLKMLGIEDVFLEGQADLSKIFENSKNIFINSLIHQVRITINEVETKAAAVSFSSVKSASVEEYPEITFTADHPFCYVIRDNLYKINLFSGIIRTPE